MWCLKKDARCAKIAEVQNVVNMEQAVIIEYTDTYTIWDYPIFGRIKIYHFPEFSGVNNQNQKGND
jgi:hypothetical protein